MIENAQPIERIEDIPAELRPLFIEAVKAARSVQEAEIKLLAAKLGDGIRRGYDLAVRSLADDGLYMQWWESAHCAPDGPPREHLVRYLQDVAPGGTFWEVES